MAVFWVLTLYIRPANVLIYCSNYVIKDVQQFCSVHAWLWFMFGDRNKNYAEISQEISKFIQYIMSYLNTKIALFLYLEPVFWKEYSALVICFTCERVWRLLYGLWQKWIQFTVDLTMTCFLKNLFGVYRIILIMSS